MYAQPVGSFGFTRAAPAALTPSQFDFVEIEDDDEAFALPWQRNQLARVGADGARLMSGDDVAAYGSLVDGRYKATDSAIAKWLLGKYGSGIVNNTEPGFVAEGSRLTADDFGFVQSWKGTFQAWRIYWGGVLNSVQLPIEAGSTHDRIGDFDRVVRDWQKRANAKGANIYIDPTPPAGQPTTASWWDSFGTLVWIAGVGLLIWFGLSFIAPALIGAAATSRGSYRTLRSA